MHQIYISEINRNDIPYLHWVENLEEYWKINEHPGPFSTTEITNFFFPQKVYYLHNQQRWIIHKSDNHTSVGIIDIFDFDAKKKSIGIGILIPNNQDHNKGYGSDAIEKIITKLLFDNKVRVIFALIDGDNFASTALFKKAGFEYQREQICLNRTVSRYEKLLSEN